MQAVTMLTTDTGVMDGAIVSLIENLETWYGMFRFSAPNKSTSYCFVKIFKWASVFATCCVQHRCQCTNFNELQ